MRKLWEQNQKKLNILNIKDMFILSWVIAMNTLKQAIIYWLVFWTSVSFVAISGPIHYIFNMSVLLSLWLGSVWKTTWADGLCVCWESRSRYKFVIVALIHLSFRGREVVQWRHVVGGSHHSQSTCFENTFYSLR